MLNINEKTYKTIASNISREVNKLTNEKTLTAAKTLEILAISFGYKNYNSILPSLISRDKSSIEIYNSKEDLMLNGYIDIYSLEEDYFPKIPVEVERDIYRVYQIGFYHFFKAAFLTQNKKFFFILSKNEILSFYKEIDKNTIKKIKKDLKFLELTLGVVFRYIWKNHNSDLVIYTNKNESINFIIDKDTNEEENYFLKFTKEQKRESIGKILYQDDLFYFVKRDYLKTVLNDCPTKINKVYSDDMVFFRTEQELIISNRLIGDGANVNANNFFSCDKEGLLKAKYITRYYPDISTFIYTKIYGYVELTETNRFDEVI